MMGRSLLGGLAVSIFFASVIGTGACNATILDFDGDAGTPDASTDGATGVPRPQICGQKMCPDGQYCCYATSTCFDAAAGAQACGNADGGVAPTFGEDLSGDLGNVCWSDLDCGPGKVCLGACAGPGGCEPPEVGPDCGSSSRPYTVCGCDGKNYPSIEVACGAAVRLAGHRACGKGPAYDNDPAKVVCAFDSNCAQGFRCCGFNGLCFDENEPGDCVAPGGAPGSSCDNGETCQTFCYQTSCGGPKVCAREQNPGCDNQVVAPVCGCNGKGYANRNCAIYHGTTVAHDGPCP
jgi:hypothetical protein